MKFLKALNDSRGMIRPVQAALIALGAVFVIIGVWRGEVATVLMKAIYICLECIGIG
ncbi:MAG: CD1871A family CXXC motif-containing protein [Christensenellales bacterium]|jgi:hypothetical protein